MSAETNAPRISIVPAAATTDMRLSALDVRILAILGREQAQHGFARLNRRQIAQWARCSEGSVPRSVRKLVSLGYLERRAAFDGKVQSANEYRTRLDQPLEYAPAKRGDMEATGGMEVTPPAVATGVLHVTPQMQGVTALKQPKSSGRGDLHATGDRGATGGEFPPTPPLVSSPSKRAPKGAPKGSPNPPGFDEAWGRWPQRGRSSKAKSLTAWERAERQHGATAMLGAVDAFLASPDALKDQGQFVPAFERWLRDRLVTWLELTARRPAALTDEQIRQRRLAHFAATGSWRDEWGPRPSSPAQEARA